ncbi:hypothetical protein FOMPIDRAFT_86644 [Fomitopsis schrenkii]|uniref:Uncharacterized protein n=1 Tax=Fomitopsis schrenkii TaxID=2126942 RepID=S8E9H3_FOMSC|nr:hypothetical protein FOMPIDRAFT_86644 [Fomitopsis schrenkii]
MWTSIESDIVVVYVSGHPHVFESGMGKASSAGCDSVERRGVQIYGGVWKGTTYWCLARLRTTCSMRMYIRTGIVEKLWEDGAYLPSASLHAVQSLAAVNGSILA